MARMRRAAGAALFRAGRTADRMARLSHYMAVGTLRLADLRDHIRNGWDDFYATDPLPVPGLLPWEELLADRFLAAGSEVLVMVCGNGRDLLALAERGCRITGVEPSGTAIEQARRALGTRHAASTLVPGFFEDARLCGTYDAVIFSYHCYAFIPVSARRIESLRKAASLLAPGGHIFVSYASGAARPRSVLINAARLVAAICRSDWRLEAGDLVWENRGRRPTYSYTHAFRSGELEQEAAAAGLGMVCSDVTASGSLVAVLTRT
jgi:SAM-dependent methyltransferase